MALPTRRVPPRALTASATRLGRSAEQTQYQRRLSQPWQLRALSYYDQIGEISFTSKFLARQIGRVRFYPARRRADGTIEEITEGTPVDLLNQIQDPGGGQSQLLFDFGRLMFITGEGVLFGYSDGTRWKFLWKDEVKINEQTGEAVRLNANKQETNERGVAYRFWTPHPRHSDEPDSPMRSVMDICEELIILTMSVRSTAVTRLTNGMTIIPLEAMPSPADEPEYQGDEDPQTNPLLSDYIEHNTAAIENPGSPEAASGFLFTPPYDYADRISHLKMHDPATDYMEKDLRTEAIKRLSLSLDMSPEDLLGYTDANHWTSRSVQLDRWRMFGYNKAELWASSLNDAYLRPGLEEEDEDPSDILVAFDDSQVVISPDRTEDAIKAHAQGIINGEAARTALGWKESDKLEGEEKEEFFALKLREPLLLDGEMALPARGPLPSTNGRNPQDGPPEPSANRGVSRQEARTASLQEQGAALMALRRCREVAGARLRRLQQTCPECQEATDQKPNAIVAAILGTEQVSQLGVTDPRKLVAGGCASFREQLLDWGHDPSWAETAAQMIQDWAAKTLFEQSPQLPSGFIAHIERAKEVSGALDSA